jgi:hypothetical protein
MTPFARGETVSGNADRNARIPREVFMACSGGKSPPADVFWDNFFVNRPGLVREGVDGKTAGYS